MYNEHEDETDVLIHKIETSSRPGVLLVEIKKREARKNNCNKKSWVSETFQ